MRRIVQTIRQILIIPALLSIYLALAIIEHRERSFTTTLPAPITEFFPIVTPGTIIVPAPIQTFSPI